MYLEEFIKAERRRLKQFELYWLKKAAKYPENFPTNNDETEWEARLNTFIPPDENELEPTE